MKIPGHYQFLKYSNQLIWHHNHAVMNITSHVIKFCYLVVTLVRQVLLIKWLVIIYDDCKSALYAHFSMIFESWVESSSNCVPYSCLPESQHRLLGAQKKFPHLTSTITPLPLLLIALPRITKPQTWCSCTSKATICHIVYLLCTWFGTIIRTCRRS